jgi:hypothetical protein
MVGSRSTIGREPSMQRRSRRIAIRSLVFLAASPLVVAPSRSFAAEGVPLAIKGYDPIAYFTVGKPTPGLPELEYEWDERRYRFSRAEHRELFKADPARYAPQFADFCAMALSLGEIVVANPEIWLVSNGRLYIFGKPTGPALFKQDLARNLGKGNQNRALVQKR